MSRDRRTTVVLAGLLAALCASIPHLSRALHIPELPLLIAAGAGEALLVVRLVRIGRGLCTDSGASPTD